MSKVTPEQKRIYDAEYRERTRARVKEVPAAKRCGACETEKDASEFWRMSASPDGLQYRCKACATSYEKTKYGPGRPKPGKRRRELRKKYGLTEGEYAATLIAQGCRCAICERHVDEVTTKGVRLSDRAFRVDHDHDTDKVRGILCNTCNRAIGMWRDDVTLLQKAIDYLIAHKDVLTEGK